VKFLTAGILTVTALILAALSVPSLAIADGMTHISGIGFFDVTGTCSDPQGQGSDFALTMTGDLQGCLYTFVETSVCSPSGTYRETGREIFVGQGGSFATTYKFEAKYQDCANLTGEIIGRCQHPIVSGSGTGFFEGVKGRLDFKDDVVAGNFPYRGHLR
jgi:hypothetical protein